MNQRLWIITVSVLWFLMASGISVFAAGVNIPGAGHIAADSIQINQATGGGEEAAKAFAFSILGILKLVVSGFALIYLVMIGVSMILKSDSEENTKTQKKQITYALIAFLFLNVPSMLYQIFGPSVQKTMITGVDNWSDPQRSYFWDTYGFEGLFGNMIAFFRVFVFGVAVLMFTWWLFRLIVSAGDEEIRKTARNRIIYGSLALIFMGFVELWARLVSVWDFSSRIPTVGKQIFGLALYFAGPVAIFMLMWWAYYYITSGGDEERIKKGKSIVINTLIAVIILLGAMSLLNELSSLNAPNNTIRK